MYAIFENTGTFEALLVSIPESVGLLAFGLGLIGAATAIRWLFDQTGIDSEAKGTGEPGN